MLIIASALYFLFVIFVILSSAIVVWHLFKYSMDKKLAKITIAVFLIITFVLLTTSLFIFFDVAKSFKKNPNQIEYYNQDTNPYSL